MRPMKEQNSFSSPFSFYLLIKKRYKQDFAFCQTRKTEPPINTEYQITYEEVASYVKLTLCTKYGRFGVFNWTLILA